MIFSIGMNLKRWFLRKDKMHIRRYYITLLITIFLFAISGFESAFAATASKQINNVFNAVDGIKVKLKSKYGNVAVYTWDQPRVRITAVIKVDARNNREANEFLDRIDLEFKAEPDIIEIISNIPQLPVTYKKEGFFDFLKGDPETRVSIDVELWVPVRSDLDLETTKGEIKADGITGQIRASTTEKKIDLDNINGSIKAYTTESEIKAKLLSLNMDDIELSTSNSDIDLYIPDQSDITLQAKAVEGDIKSAFDIQKRGKYSKETVFGWINSGGINVKLYTRKGRINIKRS